MFVVTEEKFRQVSMCDKSAVTEVFNIFKHVIFHAIVLTANKTSPFQYLYYILLSCRICCIAAVTSMKTIYVINIRLIRFPRVISRFIYRVFR